MNIDDTVKSLSQNLKTHYLAKDGHKDYEYEFAQPGTNYQTSYFKVPIVGNREFVDGVFGNSGRATNIDYTATLHYFIKKIDNLIHLTKKYTKAMMPPLGNYPKEEEPIIIYWAKYPRVFVNKYDNFYQVQFSLSTHPPGLQEEKLKPIPENTYKHIKYRTGIHIYMKLSGYWGLMVKSPPTLYAPDHPYAKAQAFINKLNGKIRKQLNEV